MTTLIMTRLSECFITALCKSEIEAKWNISVMEKNQVCPKVEDVSIHFLQ